MKKIATILGLAAVHFVTSRMLFFWSFGKSMARFETGEPPSVSEAMLGAVVKLLDFPVLITIDFMPSTWFPGLWGYIPFAANSVLWGVCIYYVVLFVLQRRVAVAGDV